MTYLRREGFTLIELIIVMAVLGILVTSVVGAFTGKRERARDARRQQDIKAIQDAMEQYYSLCGTAYPTPASGYVPAAVFCPAPTVAFVNPAPKDPLSGNAYTMSGGGTSYQICATLEKAVAPTPTGYCANNQQ